MMVDPRFFLTYYASIYPEILLGLLYLLRCSIVGLGKDIRFSMTAVLWIVDFTCVDYKDHFVSFCACSVVEAFCVLSPFGGLRWTAYNVV